jgi:hypothetical protein
MARKPLPLLAHLPQLEADGITHRRDCECVRCDAGFRPTEHDRTQARERWQLAKAQQAAARALDRRREKVRAKKFALVMELEADARATDQRITALRAARTRVDSDDRLAMLQRLRSEGVPLAEALAKVDRMDRVGPAGIEPATRGLKVPCSTS